MCKGPGRKTGAFVFLARETDGQGLAKLDKNRQNKGSNDDWEPPGDPDAKITKMKDARTHLAHNAEHAVDLDTEAIVSVTVQPANRGDGDSLDETLDVLRTRPDLFRSCFHGAKLEL